MDSIFSKKEAERERVLREYKEVIEGRERDICAKGPTCFQGGRDRAATLLRFPLYGQVW